MNRVGVLAGIFLISSTLSASSLCADEVHVPANTVELKFENLRSILEEKSSRVRAAKLEQEAAQARIGSLGRSFLPKIEVHAAHEVFKFERTAWQNEPMFGAEFNSNLYNGGQDRIDSEIRVLEAERRAAISNKVLSEELQSVRQKFWEIVSSNERIELLDSMLKTNFENLTQAQRRIRGGVATETDRVEFEMKRVDLRRDLAEAKNRREKWLRQLAVELGFTSKTELRFPEKLQHTHDFEELLRHNSKDHEFLFRDEMISGKKAELAASKWTRNWLPKVEAFAGFNRFNEREEMDSPDGLGRKEETVVGIRFRVNTDELMNLQNEANALRKEAAAKIERVEFQRRAVEAHVDSELAELRFLHDQVHDAEANIVRAERYYKMTQSEYSRGVKNSPDVLGASEKLFDSKIKRIELILEFQIAKSHLLAKLGR